MTSNDFQKIIFTIICVLMMFVIVMVSAHNGRTDIQRDCEVFGAFANNGKLFECREKGKAQ
jgi:hypothetical protein